MLRFQGIKNGLSYLTGFNDAAILQFSQMLRYSRYAHAENIAQIARA